MTKTNTQMLADLNALRVAKNLKPLKAWKESTVKLAECLAKMGGKIAQPEGITYAQLDAMSVKEAKKDLTVAADGDTVVTEKPKASRYPQVASRKANVAAKAAGEPKPVKAAVVGQGKKRVLGEGEVHLTAIANSMKLAPKTARAIARQHKVAIAKLQVSGKKYVFTKANVAAVRTILETPSKK